MKLTSIEIAEWQIKIHQAYDELEVKFGKPNPKPEVKRVEVIEILVIDNQIELLSEDSCLEASF